MKPWHWIAIVGGVLLVMAAIAAETLRRLSQSNRAQTLGIDNVPTGKDAQRLEWTATQEAPVLALLREIYPGARTTSGYRSPALNEATPGASSSSYHRWGLALDFGGIGGPTETRRAAAHVRANANRLPVQPRTVIAEDDHVHVEWFDPLGELEAPRATSWLQERIPTGQTPRFEALA